MHLVRLLKVLGPLTYGLLLAMVAESARGETNAAGSIPGPVSSGAARFNEAHERAKRNDVEAKLVLGWMYEEGIGVSRSFVDAANWWLMAAAQGLDTAQLVGKCMYADLPGCPESSGEGLKWWLQTAEQALATAQTNQAATKAIGTGSNADQDYAKVVEGYRIAAEQGDVFALGELGWMYYSGRGVAQDKEKAVQLWRKAGPQAGIANARAERSGRWDLIRHTGQDSARASLGLWVASNTVRLSTRWKGYVTGAVVEVLPDGIRYIGEDGVPCSLLRTEDMSEDVKKEYHLSNKEAEDYRNEQKRRDWVLSRRPSVKHGTGFFVSEDGYLLTCHHVVADATSVQISLRGSEPPLLAVVVREDPANDLALLKVSKGSRVFPCLPLGPGYLVRQGSDALTVGFPLTGLEGKEPKAAYGPISALSGFKDNPTQLQFQAPIQPGNSGGALVDYRGNVIGVVSSKLNEGALFIATGGELVPQNVNYAVKSDYALALIPAEVKRKEPYGGEERKREDVTEEVRQATVWIRAE